MLENLSPARVFRFFEELSAIPRGSGNTDAVSDYCVRFAKKRGLDCVKDQLNNVIIRKPASKGYEGHGGVILQGHLDMVCEKTADSGHDFTRDGLKLRVDGDLLSAEGTTLGADDGIAVAMALAVLDDDALAHPPIEAVFTVDEETGMYGAEGLDVKQLRFSTLINLDSGEEGVLTVGCAGGAKADFTLPVKREKNTEKCFKIALSGLLGGHSGIDINKGRLNADKLLVKLLTSLGGEFKLVSIDGGFKDNVIPNACECVIACASFDAQRAADFVEAERLDTDAGLKIEVSEVAPADACLDAASTGRVLGLISTMRSGVTAMSRSIEGHVQSSMNLGVVRTEDDCVALVASVRSSVIDDKCAMLAELKDLAERFSADVNVHGEYPAWEYREHSRLRDTFVAAYSDMYGKAPVIETVHAGLECGLFNEKIANFDAVSLGPDMWDIHTVNERLSIASTERTYKYLCEVLRRL